MPSRSHTSPTAAPSRWDAHATIAIFLIALWLPLAATLLGPAQAVSPTENRFLAEMPTLSWNAESAGGIPEALEAWYDDHLGFRKHLIRAHAYAHVAWLGVSPSDKLIVGKEGWFYFNHAAAIAQHRGLASLDDAQLRAWRVALEQRRNWLRDRGIGFVLVLAPNKHAIYPEYMSDHFPRTGAGDPHTQLAEHLRLHSDVTVVDLMPLLLEAKSGQRVYHRTDTHWNDVGAYLAYTQILSGVARELPASAESLQPVDVEPRTRLGPGMGLTSIVGLSRLYGEEMLELVKREPRAEVAPEHRRNQHAREQRQLPLALGVPDPKLPRAVVFRDSFANALIPYLSENFRRILFVWERDIDLRVIEIERPDVVIHEIVGRFLGGPPPDLASLERRRPDRPRGR